MEDDDNMTTSTEDTEIFSEQAIADRYRANDTDDDRDRCVVEWLENLQEPVWDSGR